MPRRKSTRKEPAENPYGSDEEDGDDDDDSDADSDSDGEEDASLEAQREVVPKKTKGKAMKTKAKSVKKRKLGSFIRPVPAHILFSSYSAASTPDSCNSSSLTNSSSTAEAGPSSSSAKPPPKSLLMKPPPQSSLSSTPNLSLATADPRIRYDFFAVRKRAFDEARMNGVVRSLEERIPSSVWDGVSSVEKEMILCCEATDVITTPTPMNIFRVVGRGSGTSSSNPHINDHLYYPLGGVLAVDKEVHFATILAAKQHTMGTMSLAVAILERTIEQYLWEQQQQQQQQSPVKTEQNGEERVGNVSAADSEDFSDPDSTKTRSSRFTRIQKAEQQGGSNNKKRSAANRTSHKLVSDVGTDNMKKERTACRNERLERFFGAGGLRVLSEWLSDAAAYEEPVQFKAQSNSKQQKGDTNGQPKVTVVASSTRPIALSILRFLEHIPFDKTCVTESKINKQVQKLGKKISSTIDAYERGSAPPEDIENWNLDPSVQVADALNQVGDAVAAVKKSWKEKAKVDDATAYMDPFKPLRDTMKARVKEYVMFQEGDGKAGGNGVKKPEWYRPPTSNKSGTKRPSSEENVSAEEQKKRKTLEMAAKERMAEREKFQQQLSEVRKKQQETLAKLQDKLRKRMESSRNNGGPRLAAAASDSATATGRVSWKDGEKSSYRRDRRVLEEVFVFDIEAPSATGTLS